MTYAWFMVALFVLLPAASLIGYGVGKQMHARVDEAGKSHASTWQGALLALAGLLIGFTFSMAQARYDARKQIVLGEANHIGTTYLRTHLLDDRTGEELRALLRRYVDADRARVKEALDRSSALADEIWTRVAAAGRAERSAVTALVIASTNDMLDAGEEHVAAVENPLPPTVFLVLVLVTGIAMASIGFTCGFESRIRVLGMFVMPLLLATVIALVFDIAHPRIGVVRVHDPVLARLRQSF